MNSLEDNNPEVYKMFSEGNLEYFMRDDRKSTGLTPYSLNDKAGYSEVP